MSNPPHLSCLRGLYTAPNSILYIIFGHVYFTSLFLKTRLQKMPSVFLSREYILYFDRSNAHQTQIHLFFWNAECWDKSVLKISLTKNAMSIWFCYVVQSIIKSIIWNITSNLPWILLEFWNVADFLWFCSICHDFTS